MEKWRKLAAEKGYVTCCPWCQRYCKKEHPLGRFSTCNDCLSGDVVLISTGEPAFSPSRLREDHAPWPPKGTPEYEEFCQDRQNYYPR